MGTTARLANMEQDLVVMMEGVRLAESPERCEELLGVTVQCDLKWSKQIENLTSKLRTRLTGLEKLKNVMNKSAKKNIVQGVFNSVLCYCIPLFGGCNKSEIHQLQVQQNRAAQCVLNLPPRTSRVILYERLGWLTVLQLIAYHTLIAVYRVRIKKEPEHLASQLCRDNIYENIIVENSKLGLYRDSFVYRGSTLWNKLPKSLRKESKIGTFKTKLVTWVEEKIARFDN